MTTVSQPAPTASLSPVKIDGVAAVEALEAGRLGVMVALKGGAIVEVPLAEVGGKNRSIDLDYPPLFPHFD